MLRESRVTRYRNTRYLLFSRETFMKNVQLPSLLPLSTMEKGGRVSKTSCRTNRKPSSAHLFLSFPTFGSAPSPSPARRTRYTGIAV